MVKTDRLLVRVTDFVFYRWYFAGLDNHGFLWHLVNGLALEEVYRARGAR